MAFSALTAAVTFPAYAQALTAPTGSSSVLRESVRRGWFAPDDEYYIELARYLEANGKPGYNPGDISWGLAYWGIYWGIYWGMMVVAIFFTRALLPSLGDTATYVFAGIAFAVALACFVAYGRRATRFLKEAEVGGFRLMQLYRLRSDIRQRKPWSR